MSADNSSTKQTGITQGVFVVLVIFALIGVVIADISPSDAHGYWVFTLGVFAAAAIYCGRKQTDMDGEPVRGFFMKQVIHWIGALVAILCVYTLLHTGRINFEEAGLIMLLVLALASFLAGTHVGWRFYVLGALLAGATVAAAYIEEFMWVIILLAVAIVALTFYWSKRNSVK